MRKRRAKIPGRIDKFERHLCKFSRLLEIIVIRVVPPGYALSVFAGILPFSLNHIGIEVLFIVALKLGDIIEAGAAAIGRMLGRYAARL